MKTLRIAIISGLLMSTAAGAAGFDDFYLSAQAALPACKKWVYLNETGQKGSDPTEAFNMGICSGRTVAVVPTPAELKHNMDMADDSYVKAQEARANWKAAGWTDTQLDEDPLLRLMVVKRSTFLCIPAGVTGPQLVAVAVRYIERHPNRLHERYEALVSDAFHEVWPCKDVIPAEANQLEKEFPWISPPAGEFVPGQNTKPDCYPDGCIKPRSIKTQAVKPRQ